MSTPDMNELRREYNHALGLHFGGEPGESVVVEAPGESARAVLRAAVASHEEAIPALEWLIDRAADDSILQEVRRDVDEVKGDLDFLRSLLRFCVVCGRLVNPANWHADPWSSGGCCTDCEEKANRGKRARTPVGNFPYWPGRTSGFQLSTDQDFRRIAAVPGQGSISHIKIGAPNIIPSGEVSVECSQGPHHEHRGASKLAVLVRLGAAWREDVTPTLAEHTRLCNAWTKMSEADRERHQGGVATRVAEYPDRWHRPDGSPEVDDGRVFLDQLLYGMSNDVPDAGGKWFVGVSDRPRVVVYRLSADGEMVGHLNIRCSCGLELRCPEEKYNAAFDKLVAAGRDRIELQHLRRFA